MKFEQPQQTHLLLLSRWFPLRYVLFLSCYNLFLIRFQAGLPDPPGFSPELLKRRDEERLFLAQLLDGSKVEQYQIPVKINAELRKYQQDGVNWLAFLAKYQLHGILCDGERPHSRFRTSADLTSFRYGSWEDLAVDLHPR